MQEQRLDGKEILTQMAEAQHISEAINNPQNKTVAIHRPGARFSTKDGIEYLVGEAGNLIRISPKRKIKPQPSSHARKRAAKKSIKEKTP